MHRETVLSGTWKNFLREKGYFEENTLGFLSIKRPVSPVYLFRLNY